MDIAAIATVLAAAVALGIAALSLTSAVVFRQGMLIPTDLPAVPVTLILPATGSLPGIEQLFAALSRQTLPPARLIVAVESTDDPAYRRIADLAKSYPALNIDLVVAGLSSERAQKCTNLLAAFARLDPSEPYIVLLDADICPQPWWLAALVGPLAAGRADVVDGYRWQAPRFVSPATALGAAVDRAIATMPRLDGLRLLWGGSLALTRPALARIDMPASLSHTLSDDFVIANRTAELGLRVISRRALRVPTPLDATVRGLWRFGRRQYQIVHIFRPGLWWFALFVATIDLAARAGLLLAAVLAAEPIAIGGLIGLILLGSVATEMRRAIGRRLEVADPPELALAQHILVWSVLAIPLFHAGIIWAGARRSPVTWAHVRYRVDRDGRVLAASR